MATSSIMHNIVIKDERIAEQLIYALERSQRVDYKIEQKVNDVTQPEKIRDIMESFLRGKE